MGRTKKAQDTKPQPDWIFNIEIELPNQGKPPIAFLSGLERTYFPEDSGFSKFSLVYQTPGLEDDSPPCTFSPQSFLLTKPISNKGYGIGGLSGSRFPLLSTPNKTSPDKYQPELTKALLHPKRTPVPHDEDIYRLSPQEPLSLKRRRNLQFQRHLQCSVSFGTYRNTPKLGKPPEFNTAGVGSYNVAFKANSKREFTSSFGRSPLIHRPATQVQCVFDKQEKCIECGEILYIADFYRTRFSVKVPWPETRQIEHLGQDFPRGMSHVNLCKFCYYHASQGKSVNWPKNKLRWLFRKTRTCSFMHEHQKISQVITRAHCSTLKRLHRKEAVLSKYYDDRVEESINAEYYN